MPYFRALAFITILGGSIVFVSPIQWLARRFDWPVHRRIQMLFCRAVCATIGIEVETRGRLAGEAPRLLVANHVSWTDIIVLASLHPLVFLAKSEVAGWPVLGFIARLQGTVFVERGNRRAIPQVNAALAQELGKGRDLVVFAEGTSSDGASVLEFKAAHFPGGDSAAGITPLAIGYFEPRGGAPVDVGWYGDMTFLPHLWSLMKRGSVICRIAYGETVAATADRKALAAAAHARVSALLAEMRGEMPERM